MMQVLDSAGQFARQFHLQGNPHAFTRSGYGLFGIIGLPVEFRPPSADGSFLEAYIWTADAEGDSLDSLGLTRFGQFRALGAPTRIAVASDRFYVVTAETPDVDIYGLDGMRTGRVSIGTSSPAPTQASYEYAIEAMLSVARSKAVRDMQRPVLPARDHIERTCGPEPGTWFPEERAAFDRRVVALQNTFTNVEDWRPLILEYDAGRFTIRDGNHRHAALVAAGCTTGWAILWYGNEDSHQHHADRGFAVSADLPPRRRNGV